MLKFGAFIGIKIEHIEQPSLYKCEDWEDNDEVIDNGVRMSWK